MSAETLRRAAALMRERAEAATPGPWFLVRIPGHAYTADVGTTPDMNEGQAIAAATLDSPACLVEDAEHIASWHPGVTLAVAKAMDDVADAWEIHDGWGLDPDDNPIRFEDTIDGGWLAVARAYLGESA